MFPNTLYVTGPGFKSRLSPYIVVDQLFFSQTSHDVIPIDIASTLSSLDGVEFCAQDLQTGRILSP